MTRRAVVLASLVLAALVAAGTAPTWVSATTASPSMSVVPLGVQGSSLAPGAGAGALVVGAAALALGISRRRGQLVALVVMAAGGVLVTASALAAPGAARSSAVGAALDAVGVPTLTTEPRLTVWPWLVAVLGLLVVVLAAVGTFGRRRWGTPSPRFEAPARSVRPVVPAVVDSEAPEPDPSAASLGADQAAADVWDALSRGEDPT